MAFDVAEVSDGGPGDRFPGFYAMLLAEAEDYLAELAAALDPRLAYPEYTPGLSAAQRAAVDKAAKAPAIRSAEARVASLKAVEPQLIPRGRLPHEVTEGITWLQNREPASAAERDETCVQVQICADDTVEIGQTVAQQRRQHELIAQGCTTGRVDLATGEWIPRAQNPATGEWEDADPADIIAMKSG